MDCATIIEWISTIRTILIFGPLIIGFVAGFTRGFGGAFFGSILGGTFGYILLVISKLPLVEKFLIWILSLLFRVGECEI